VDDNTCARLQAAEQRALDTPMPDELHTLIADYIGPYTEDLGIKHRDVFEGIEYAFPVILDHLREHPEALRG
jgi:hypothetical protein